MLFVFYMQEDHHLTSCLSTLFHACARIEKVYSLPLCASDVQYSQEFCRPGQHVCDLKTAALLNLGRFSVSSAQHLAPYTITPTKVLKLNEYTNSLW